MLNVDYLSDKDRGQTMENNSSGSVWETQFQEELRGGEVAGYQVGSSDCIPPTWLDRPLAADSHKTIVSHSTGIYEMWKQRR